MAGSARVVCSAAEATLAMALPMRVEQSTWHKGGKFCVGHLGRSELTVSAVSGRDLCSVILLLYWCVWMCPLFPAPLHCRV